MSWLFLGVSLWGAWFTYTVYRPSRAGSYRAALSFFMGFITAELALHHVAWQALATLVFVWAGALAAWPGKLGLVVTLVSWAALAFFYYTRASLTPTVVEEALCQGLGSDYRERILPALSSKFEHSRGRMPRILTWPVRHPRVECIRKIQFTRAKGLGLKLDVYRHRSRPSNCPTLLQIHGGGWVLGFKEQQAQPLMTRLAANGWVCVNTGYRLSPHATFPDHLIDVKRALRWIREHGREYGANPDFVVVSGGSAGGHLSSLLALTANDSEYQPGFEHVDTSVQGCVPLYGVYDFMQHRGLAFHELHFRDLLEKYVMKASIEEAPKEYEKASPIKLITPDAPAFFVVHGQSDSLVPVESARTFVRALREKSRAPVVYAEIPGAQHSFDILPSLRTEAVIDAIERFLAFLYSQHRLGPDLKRAGDKGCAEGI